jgi:hypothetical protein
MRSFHYTGYIAYFFILQNAQPDRFEFKGFRRSMGFVSVCATDINILHCHTNLAFTLSHQNAPQRACNMTKSATREGLLVFRSGTTIGEFTLSVSISVHIVTVCSKH